MEDLLARYRLVYWNLNELQLIACSHPSTTLDVEMASMQDELRTIEAKLGYVPAP